MNHLTTSLPVTAKTPTRKLGVGLLIISALTLLLASLNMPAGYSWLQHCPIKESALEMIANFDTRGISQ